ncbi:hypothetical protein H310_12325 [Aphanomyces invadans]|uniref:Uncharacterized protein n=1 Tax=Aphanomyces invadans TaxID=157072 RepID=A0A024TIC9_9STRA|nr:hypothetical protein H310_12325 [Aphanomyces invadans]ETV93759.1 hypothetical protein H310_12325 [Aphanomyces invadans]|eukprot:XP_008877568.1 hypothetical protein H310_12325 [Aphanomyces invadans]
MLVTYPVLGVGQAKHLIAICGGGGSAKTGVKNTVDVYSMPSRGKPYRLLGSADTGSELPSSVAISPDGTWLAVSVNAACWVYEITPKVVKDDNAPDDASPSLDLVLRVRFRTDFSAVDSSQTCACFVGSHTLVTGGEDSVVRIWSISTTNEATDVATSSSLAVVPPSTASKQDGEEAVENAIVPPVPGDQAVHGTTVVRLTKEYRGHTKRIKQIHVDPFSRNAVVTSDEAATCHLWRLDKLTSFFRATALDTLDQVFQSPGFPKPPTKGPVKHQFRCVRLAPNGQALFTVLSPPRGDAYLVKWVPMTLSQEDATLWPWRVAAVALAGPEPVGSLTISDDGAVVVTATASGDIFTFNAIDLTCGTKSSPEDHTFAITGLVCQSVVPDSLYRLCSAGADKRLLMHRVELSTAKDGLTWPGTFVALALSVVVGVIVAGTGLVYFHASQSLLLSHPFQGINAILASKFESNDAMATIMACLVGLLASLVSWIVCLQSRALHGVFWIGLALLILSCVSLWVAATDDLRVQWVSGVDLLEYKACIVTGVTGVVFLLLHSIGLMVL